MTKHSLRSSVRPTLEALEDRCTPAGTVTGSLAGGVWTLTGDNAANWINVNVASSGSPGAFTVIGLDTGLFPYYPFSEPTTVNGVTTPTGVHKIAFNMKGGNDSVTVNGVKLTSMVFLGGDGNNTFTAERFTLTNALHVVNGVGYDILLLNNFKIGGNVNINNGSGGSGILIQTLSAASGFNNIAGNLSITNGSGRDLTTIEDTNVGGNITANNGAGDGTDAGKFRLFNLKQTGRRAVVGGNVTATFLDGNMHNGIWDAVVRGNVLFNNGSGAAETYFDGSSTTLPVVIQGRLKIVGTGANLVSIGRLYHKTGLRVGQNLVIDVKDPGELTLKASKLIVNGQTKII